MKYLFKTFGKLTQELPLANEKYELWKKIKTGSSAVIVHFENVLDKLQWQPFKIAVRNFSKKIPFLFAHKVNG